MSLTIAHVLWYVICVLSGIALGRFIVRPRWGRFGLFIAVGALQLFWAFLLFVPVT